jgi:hypothetical protein
VKTAARNRCHYGNRARKRVAPIVEERNVYDVWPARAANHASSVAAVTTPTTNIDDNVSTILARPQLLVDLQQYIADELASLRAAFPDVPEAKVRTVQPAESEISRVSLHDADRTILAAVRATKQGRTKEATKLLSGKQATGAAHDGPNGSALDGLAAPCSREDDFRLDRVRLFSESLAEFARHFKAYRPLLLWILREFDDFAVYCHRHVWSPEARESFKQQSRAEAAAVFADEKRDLQGRIVDLQNELTTVRERLAKYESAQATIRLQLDDKDRVIAQRDREIQENTEGRTTLLTRMTRLEKELWQQRTKLEEPEKKLQEMQRAHSDLQEKLTRAQRLFEEHDRERAVHRDRIERLEEQIRDLKKKQQATGLNAMVKAEMMAYKKRELDVLEQNAKLQARISHVEYRLKESQEALRVSRGDAPSTPRPNWNDFVDVCKPGAPNTMKRVQDLVGAHRQLLRSHEATEQELSRLQELIGTSYRDDLAALPPGSTITANLGFVQSVFLSSEDVVPDMRAAYFPKLGLNSHVPGYLKGTGKVKNLRFGRDMMQTFARNLWMGRQAVKAGAPWDLFLSKFLADQCPHSIKPDAFAYNVHHAMGWFAYDPFIGFTRNLMLGLVDEAVFLDMQLAVTKMRQVLLTSANTNDAISAIRGANDVTPPPPASAAAGGRSPVVSALPVPVDGGAPRSTLLTKTKLASALIDTCVDRADLEVKQLIVAASRDCPGRAVDVDMLFNFDAERGRFSHFLEEAYRQYFVLRRRLIADISDALYALETDEEARISPPAVAACLLHHDPHMPVQYLDDLVARMFSVSIEQLFPAVDKYSTTPTVGLEGERVYGCQDTLAAEVPELIAQMQQGVLRRFEPPESPSIAGAGAESPNTTGASQRSRSPVQPAGEIQEEKPDADIDDAALEAMAA